MLRRLSFDFASRNLKNFLISVSLLLAVSGMLHGQMLPLDTLSLVHLKSMGYRFPINPGMPGLLAGTMGELRNTHFHAGIDIRTNNAVGIPVITTQRGYISRAIVGAYGYGKALFVTHPDGNTSVYGHLDSFKGAVADFVRNQQYLKKSFDTDLFFSPGQFSVKDGDTLALSGNTGGSSGPHLHFEIRDSLNDALNPLLFGFREITDTYAPAAQKIALKTLDIHSRINDKFGRFEFYLFKTGSGYILPQPILAYGRIGLEILAYDKMDRSGFKCGINEIDLFAGEQKIFSQVIDRINFEESRGILGLMDFKSMKTKGERFNKLYTDDRTRLDFHKTENKGEVKVSTEDVAVKILLRDSYHNQSEVKLTLRHSPPAESTPFAEPMAKSLEYDLEENTLVLSVKACPPGQSQGIMLFARHEKLEMKPSYTNAGKSVYLIDLHKILPDSAATCQGAFHFNFQDAIPSGTDYKFYHENADIFFRNGALYDTLFLTLNKSLRDSAEIFSIGDRTIPLHQPIDITLKPTGHYADNDKAGVYLLNSGYNFIPCRRINGRLQFQTQELGDFAVLIDSVAPYVRAIRANSTGASFRIKDELSGIARFEATIDGEWLLMNYDYKTGLLQSERLNKNKPLKGNLQLKVVDNAGNEKIINQKIL